MSNLKCVGIVPAKGHSIRVPGKNTRELAGHPLFAYSVVAALESGVMDRVVVASEDMDILNMAVRYGADAWYESPDLPRPHRADIDWVSQIVKSAPVRDYDCFSLLRPTSPFRTADTIRSAWNLWNTYVTKGIVVDSLRAVEPASQHPGKQWRMDANGFLQPLLLQPKGTPWHSSPYEHLPEIWQQNASLEIAWLKTVTDKGSIAGDSVVGFLNPSPEGFDINTEYDWQIAEQMLKDGSATLPEVRVDARSPA